MPFSNDEPAPRLRDALAAPVGALCDCHRAVVQIAKSLDLQETHHLDRVAAGILALSNMVEAGPRPSGAECQGTGSDEAGMRHDLRTPLNAIIGFGEMAIEDAGDLGAEDLVAPLETLLSEARKLVGVIDGLGASGDGAGASAGIPTQARGDSPRRAAPSRREHRAPLRGRVLVVDDNADNRELLRRRIEQEGHRAEVASSGRGALDRLEHADFDLVLLDLVMPDMDGFDVLRSLKGDPRWRDIPVIMISGHTETEAAIRCIEAGAEDYLPKPFDPVLLRARLNASLERKHWLDQLRREQALRLEQERKLNQLLIQEQRRTKAELAMAARVQRSILPPDPLSVGPVLMHAEMRPAREVGGDLYDYFQLGDGRIGCLIGDVAGKGAAAALVMGMTYTTIRSLIHLFAEPWELLSRANADFARHNHEQMFVTLFYGILDPESGRLDYCNAGHNPPVLLRRNGAQELLRATGIPFGILEDTAYRGASTVLGPGDVLFLYTDGVTEAVDPEARLFGESRLMLLLERVGRAPPARLVAEVHDAVSAHCNGMERSDDVACLALRYGPE